MEDVMSNNTKMPNKVLLYGLVLIIGTFWGISFLMTSLLVRTLDAVQILAARWLIAAVIYGTMIAIGKIRIDLSKKTRFYVLICTLCQPCLYMICENNGIKYTSASVGSIMIATIPCVVIILNMIFFKKKTSGMGLFSILLAFAGVATCTMFSPAFSIHGDLKGYFLMMGAVLGGALFTVFAARTEDDYSSLELTACMAIVGAVFFNALNFSMGYGFSTYTVIMSDWRMIGGILFLGVCCSAICFLAFNKTITLLDPALANNMNASMTTIVGAVAGIVFAGDPGGWYTVVGLAMTLGGVILSSRQV